MNEDGKWICPSCGEENYNAVDICQHCFHVIEKEHKVEEGYFDNKDKS